VDIGAKAKVTLTGPVGPTCTLKVVYPSGIGASLPEPTHPKPGAWTWTWTIPSKAAAGTAQGTATCTYAGVPHRGPISFKILNPTLPGGYVINVVSPSSRAWTDTSELQMTIKVTGTVPSNPTYGVSLTCNFILWSYNNLWTVNVYSPEYDYANGTGHLDAGFQLDPALTADWVGQSTWTVRCRNIRVADDQWKADNGTIDITAG
jgi:hypothetical protein